jgi:hypothetical protein
MSSSTSFSKDVLSRDFDEICRSKIDSSFLCVQRAAGEPPVRHGELGVHRVCHRLPGQGRLQRRPGVPACQPLCIWYKTWFLVYIEIIIRLYFAKICFQHFFKVKML